ERKVDASTIERLMSRIICVFPCYSIESWLYQNLESAKSLCATHHRNCDFLAEFSKWEKDRSCIDEIEEIKYACCLRSKYNKSLAESAFPTQAAYDAGKSFKDAVDLGKSSSELCAALQRTYS